MKEIRYWEAEDGTKFEDEQDCVEYEQDCRWCELLEKVPCYTSDYKRVTKEDEGIFACNIAYILVPPSKGSAEFDDAYTDLDDEFFGGDLPYLGDCNPNGDLVFRDDSNLWYLWSNEMTKLREMADRFQMFEEKGE